MNLALELFLSAFATIICIVAVMSIIAKLIGTDEE